VGGSYPELAGAVPDNQTETAPDLFPAAVRRFVEKIRAGTSIDRDANKSAGCAIL
jgi:hypothetical protein